MMRKFWSTSRAGMKVTVHRFPGGRFTLHMSREGSPGQARVHLALSLAHVVRLLSLHTPEWHAAAA